MGRIKIVVETVLNRGAYGELGTLKKLLHRLRHDVGGRVTDDFDTLRGVDSNGLHLEVAVNNGIQIYERAVDLCSNNTPLVKVWQSLQRLAYRHPLLAALFTPIGVAYCTCLAHYRPVISPVQKKASPLPGFQDGDASTQDKSYPTNTCPNIPDTSRPTYQCGWSGTGKATDGSKRSS